LYSDSLHVTAPHKIIDVLLLKDSSSNNNNNNNNNINNNNNNAPGDVIISRLCSASCTGFLCGSAPCPRLRVSSTGPSPATPRVTWPTTVSSPPTPMSDNCVLSTLEHSSSVGRAAVLETGPLPPHALKSGTVCRPISDYVGCHTASSGGY